MNQHRIQASRRRLTAAAAAAVMGGSCFAGCAVSREVAARAFHLTAKANPAPPDRRSLPGGITSVCSRGTISWIVPVDDGGVVLIDAGFDDEARAIRHAVGDRKIHGILLTHGHLDHVAGTSTLDAPVWIGRADAPAVQGRPVFRSVYPRLGEFAGGVPTARGAVHVVDGGEVVRFGSRAFVALATPGHTAGSVVWLLDDVLFGGDALQSPLGDGVYPAPAGFTADLVVAYDSMRRLRDVPFRWLADAHYGVMASPHARIRAAVERQHDDATLRDHPALRPVACGDDPVSW
jgi:glyoxylase-like metal-dependent hydrolase (beta-lactamase superfamily II)